MGGDPLQRESKRPRGRPENPEQSMGGGGRTVALEPQDVRTYRKREDGTMRGTDTRARVGDQVLELL